MLDATPNAGVALLNAARIGLFSQADLGASVTPADPALGAVWQGGGAGASAMVLTPAMLQMRASKFISAYRKGSIHGEFPSQYLNSTVAEIKAAASGRNASSDARKAWKLLNDTRFGK